MLKEGDLRRRAFLRLAAMGLAATQFGVMGTAQAQSDQSTPDEEGEITEAAAPTLPDYAPVPRSALGPALNERGYFVGRVKRNLYWVTDGTYQAAFLTTREGVVLFDAPPTIGHNIQRAVDEIAAANGLSNEVTPYFFEYGENTWAAVRGYLDAITAAAAAPVIEKYTRVLAAAGVFTASTTFHVMQSLRLDLGYGSQVHP